MTLDSTNKYAVVILHYEAGAWWFYHGAGDNHKYSSLPTFGPYPTKAQAKKDGDYCNSMLYGDNVIVKYCIEICEFN